MDSEKAIVDLALTLPDIETLVEAISAWQNMTRGDHFHDLVCKTMSLDATGTEGMSEEEFNKHMRAQAEAKQRLAMAKLKAHHDNKHRRGVELSFKLYKLADSLAASKVFDDALSEPLEEEKPPLDEQPLGNDQPSGA